MEPEQEIKLILLNVGFAEHHADWNWEKISSPFFRIYLIGEGEATVIIDNITYLLLPGHLYLIPPFTTHTDCCNGYFTIYYIHIYEDLKNNISLFDQMLFPVQIDSCYLDELLIKRLHEINPSSYLRRYDPSTYDNRNTLMQSIAENTHIPLSIQLETNGILFQLFSKFMLKAHKLDINQDTRILKVLHFIYRHIESKISISELATQCFMSNDHFIRLFKQELKMTPISYINKKKIEKAQLMLLIKNMAIKDIAYSLSFENVSYFNRTFKHYVGKTPMEFKSEYN
ncbi:MAG: AraC family transcriptional regulator [Bacteroidota bacterium]|nr:AraC family transcriptional regulator [Bacteroidota bacterium]